MKEQIDKLSNCPNCGSSWDGGSILETFIKQRDEGFDWCKGMSDEEIKTDMEKYYSSPYRWGRLIGVILRWGELLEMSRLRNDVG